MAEKAGSGLKDLLLLVVVFAGILGGLFAYTQVWPPAVIVESGSMMHHDSEVSYGRSWLTGGPATIDPGDLVLVKDVDEQADVETWVEGGTVRYGAAGDVVVYYAGGQEGRTPIIHRAMAWVDVERENGDVRYVVHWSPDTPCPPQAETREGDTCVFGSEGITIEAMNLHNYKPFRGGLITKGDNPVTNTRPDQVSGLSDIVQVEWIQGKGRAEVPWLGLIKLSLSPSFNERNCVTGGYGFKMWEESRVCTGWVAMGRAYAPKDLWVMLGISLFVLVGLPLAYDVVRAVNDRRSRRDTEAEDPWDPPYEAPAYAGDVPGGESPSPELPVEERETGNPAALPDEPGASPGREEGGSTDDGERPPT